MKFTLSQEILEIFLKEAKHRTVEAVLFGSPIVREKENGEDQSIVSTWAWAVSGVSQGTDSPTECYDFGDFWSAPKLDNLQNAFKNVTRALPGGWVVTGFIVSPEYDALQRSLEFRDACKEWNPHCQIKCQLVLQSMAPSEDGGTPEYLSFCLDGESNLEPCDSSKTPLVIQPIAETMMELKLFRIRGRLPLSYHVSDGTTTLWEEAEYLRNRILSNSTAFVVDHCPSIVIKSSIRESAEQLDDTKVRGIWKEILKAREEKDELVAKHQEGNFDCTLDLSLVQNVGEDATYNENVLHAPSIKQEVGVKNGVSLHIEVDCLAIIPLDTLCMMLPPILRHSIAHQLKRAVFWLGKAAKSSGIEFKQIQKLKTVHVIAGSLNFPVTLMFPIGVEENHPALVAFREALHDAFLLPADHPIFRCGNKHYFFDDLGAVGKLMNPHAGISSCDDKVNDDGWGCAYRSLQTLASWIRMEGYSTKEVPTIRDIQQCLVDIGDKPPKFVGSRMWIGSTEVGFVLEKWFGITHKISHVSSGADMISKARELKRHFETQGSPVMIGGGDLAHTILGVQFNEDTGDDVETELKGFYVLDNFRVLEMNDKGEGNIAESAEDGEESDDGETVEESPCGRWLKRREEVHQRNVPGIDNAFLAMDSEDGVEVVWNEILFDELIEMENQEAKLRRIFDNLIELEHPNIVKFHKYWLDKRQESPRVVFISEYMPSGSLKQFLKRTKSNLKRLSLQSWKRWCTQITSALSFLHSFSPPIIHGNLNCDTIFIQHNGLIKIGSVAPDASNTFVKTRLDLTKNRHCVPPEYVTECVMTTAGDIYSFGVCALEMAVFEIQSQGSIQDDCHIDKGVLDALDSLREEGNPLQLDFLQRCLRTVPGERISARELLFHPMLFEVHPLKLLAAHCLVHSSDFSSESVTEVAIQSKYGQDRILAEFRCGNGNVQQFRLSDFPVGEKLETFMEDVQFGIYPLTAFACELPCFRRQSSEQIPSPESEGTIVGGCGSTVGVGGSGAIMKSEGSAALTRNNSFASDVSPSREKALDFELRRVVNMLCTIKTNLADGDASSKPAFSLSILLRMEDKMNRQLMCDLKEDDTAESLASDLVRHSLVCRDDEPVLRGLIAEMMETLASGCSSSASAILDRTDIPISFFESGLMKDILVPIGPSGPDCQASRMNSANSPGRLLMAASEHSSN
ncbi:unnamed protein product [Notodromas monacha]|uniref:Protein kinase domain-containing protein n=1 Tax=Notodromas monacha TaxID=399045 RepID=A0A7R9GAL8_9CRUS|nr:unnamed protein product [Notodromas monacha]CAG0915400.1 unnamed protein product [Notodromas monacha]